MSQLAPEVLARLRQKQKAREAKAEKGGKALPPPLPDPGDQFSEMEACKAWGTDWGSWQLMSPTVRAEMWAHEMHRAMREAAGSDPEEESDAAPKRQSARAAIMGHYGVKDP